MSNPDKNIKNLTNDAVKGDQIKGGGDTTFTVITPGLHPDDPTLPHDPVLGDPTAIDPMTPNPDGTMPGDPLPDIAIKLGDPNNPGDI